MFIMVKYYLKYEWVLIRDGVPISLYVEKPNLLILPSSDNVIDKLILPGTTCLSSLVLAIENIFTTNIISLRNLLKDSYIT